MKLMKVDPLGDLKKNINSKDYNVVASNSKAVLKAFSDLDEYDSSSTMLETVPIQKKTITQTFRH